MSYLTVPISELIPSSSRVLDLGCGDGELLSHLQTQKQCVGYGMELNFENVTLCLKKKIPVFQSDLNEGLLGFQDQSFDFVVLSLTLQQIQNPVFLLQEMLRVGRHAIITFPNFGHFSARCQHFFGGIAPVTDSLPYAWHNTPNIRVMSFVDLEVLCRSLGFLIERKIPLHSSVFGSALSKLIPNLFAEEGLFVISKHSA